MNEFELVKEWAKRSRQVACEDGIWLALPAGLRSMLVDLEDAGK